MNEEAPINPFEAPKAAPEAPRPNLARGSSAFATCRWSWRAFTEAGWSSSGGSI